MVMSFSKGEKVVYLGTYYNHIFSSFYDKFVTIGNLSTGE